MESGWIQTEKQHSSMEASTKREGEERDGVLFLQWYLLPPLGISLTFIFTKEPLEIRLLGQHGLRMRGKQWGGAESTTLFPFPSFLLGLEKGSQPLHLSGF